MHDKLYHKRDILNYLKSTNQTLIQISKEKEFPS